MNQNVKSVYQLSKSDIRDIAQSLDLVAGPGIIINRIQDGYEIEIDQEYFQRLYDNR